MDTEIATAGGLEKRMGLCKRIYRITRKIVALVPKRSQLDAQALFTVEEFQEWSDRENGGNTPIFMTTFNKNERLVLFCKYILLWGREKIRSKTGLSERFVNDTVYKLVTSDKVVLPVKKQEI